MILRGGGIAGLWLRLHIADGENAGRAMLLPHDRVVAIVDLEGGAALAFDDGGNMQVRETAAELAELLELALDGSVVGLEDLEPLRAERERRNTRRQQSSRRYPFGDPLGDIGGDVFELEEPELRAKRVERVPFPEPSTMNPVQVLKSEMVRLEPGAYVMVNLPTRASDVVQRLTIKVIARTPDGAGVRDCAHGFALASSDLFSNHHKVPASMFLPENVLALGNFYRTVKGPVSVELSSEYPLPGYIQVTLFVQREE